MTNLLLNKYNYNKSKKIYSKKIQAFTQHKEYLIRKKFAKKKYNNFLNEISLHHSINVMDNEVKKFVNLLPRNAIICDIGGSWGWHWRNIEKIRPDIKILIIDFVLENLIIAKNILGNKINKQIFLINDDCNYLYIKKNFFDAFWSIQTLQHIPNYIEIYKKIYNQMKKGGYFYNCNLNTNLIIKFFYKIFNKNYIVSGYTKNYFIERSNNIQKKYLEKIFKNKATIIYSELLFHPDIKIYTGSKNNFFGKIDSLLSGSFILKKIFARQEAFLIKK